MAKAGLGKLAENKLKKVCKAEIKQAARQKSTNKVIQKGEIIIVKKMQ